jgi:hypothetical protein
MTCLAVIDGAVTRMTPSEIAERMLAELTSAERTALLKLLAKVLKATAAVAAAEPIPLEGTRNRPERRR